MRRNRHAVLAVELTPDVVAASQQAAQAEVDAAHAAPQLWKAQLTDGGIAGQHAAFYRLLDKVNEWYPTRVPLEQVWGIGRPLWDPASRVHGRQPLR